MEVENNRILHQMTSFQIDSERQLAELTGLPLRTICSLIKMRESPRKKNGEWRKCARTLADYFGCAVGDLFAEEEIIALDGRRPYIEVNYDDLRFLEEQEAGVDESMHPEAIASASELRSAIVVALMGLTMAERAVIRMRFGLDGAAMTLRDVGKVLDLESKRIKAILKRALRRLSNPIQKHTLKEAGAQDVLVRDALQRTEHQHAE